MTSNKAKAPPSHPKYSEMVVESIKSLKQRGGSSKAAIMKYIISNYKVGDNTALINGNIKRALKLGVTNHVLNQPKGTGASGSFQVRKADSKAAAKVKKPAKVAKKATKKPKTVKPKTAKSPAKSKVVKPKKAAAKKSPAKKPAAKKTMKPKTTVKKTIKAKKPATKKATKK
ncbi:late histone H1-like [Argonauta hians]